MIGQAVCVMAADFLWTQSQAARLRVGMRDAGIKQQELSERAGVPIATLQRILAGTSVPSQARLEALVESIGHGLTVAYVLHGEVDRSASVVEVPIFDVQVAAGFGRVPLDEAQAIGAWPFPADWVTASFGASAELKLLRVAGDSQEPELRDGDMVMINTRNPQVSEGMQVVRLDDALLIKRLQLQGATVRLRSANPAYGDIIVERDQIESEAFAVIGRAVWAGKLL